MWDKSAIKIIRLRAGVHTVPADDCSHNGWQALQVTLRSDVFIEAFPLTWSDFAEFAAARGYAIHRFWPHDRVDLSLPHDRICQLSDSAWKAGASWSSVIRALTWDEASAVCRWSGSRLPFEVEWRLAEIGTDSFRTVDGPEWTNDAFDPLPLIGEDGRGLACGLAVRPAMLAVRMASRAGSSRRGLPRSGNGLLTAARRVWDEVPRNGKPTEVVAEVRGSVKTEG